MKKQAYNPYLPSYEYIPDAEPHIFGDRVYIYGSHDKFNGISFCIKDYVCWSADVSDLSDWRYEGVIYRKKQDGKKAIGFLNSMYAPDVCQGADGRYYLYYFIAYRSLISVAVCDTPAGKYEFLGFVKYSDGTLLGRKNEPLQFDPGVFIDDDGKIYLYTGFGPENYPKILMGGHSATKQGAMAFELEKDMLTIKGDMNYIGVPAKSNAKNTAYESHPFFEASSMRKFNNKYYFIYSSFVGHSLCYAVSDSPIKDFKYGGVLVSIGDIGINGHYHIGKASNYTGNTHGSVIQIKDKYYVFYHRQTNRHQFSRQACAEEIIMNDDGAFNQAEVTSCGLNGGALKAKGEYDASIACNLMGSNGTRFYGVTKGNKREPYFTQSGKDREDNPDQYIANIQNGDKIGYKYFEFNGENKIAIKIKGNANGKMIVRQSLTGDEKAVINLLPSKKWTYFEAKFTPENKTSPLYFEYQGKGKFNLRSILID